MKIYITNKNRFDAAFPTQSKDVHKALYNHVRANFINNIIEVTTEMTIYSVECTFLFKGKNGYMMFYEFSNCGIE